MKIPANLKTCTGCSKNFFAVWEDQTDCENCQPLKINPEVQRILSRIPARF